jgi:hypothetical protein
VTCIGEKTHADRVVGEKTNADRVVVGKPEEKRPLGKPR